MSRDVRLYLADIKTQHACIRDLQVIGEAVKKLPDTLRATYRDVPWRRISGLRDILTHEYFGVDLKIIWDVLANRLGALETAVESIERNLPPEPDPPPRPPGR